MFVFACKIVICRLQWYAHILWPINGHIILRCRVLLKSRGLMMYGVLDSWRGASCSAACTN